jgi:hypothetical protein
MEQRRRREDREARGGRRQGGARLEVDDGHLAAGGTDGQSLLGLEFWTARPFRVIKSEHV